MLNFYRIIIHKQKDLTEQNIKCTIMFAIALVLQICNYAVVTPQIENDPEWTTNILAKCENADMSEAYQAKSMIDVGTTAFGFGAYYGLTLQSFYFPEIHSLTPIDENKLKPWLRIIVALCLCIPVGLMYVFIKGNNVTNVYVLMIFKTLIPALLAGIILYGLQDKANLKLGLLKFDPRNRSTTLDHE